MRAHTITALNRSGVTWELKTAKGAMLLIKPEPVLRFSSLLMVRDAVLAGAAILPKLLVANDFAKGRLSYWGTLVGPPVELWALQSSRGLVGAKIRVFLGVVERAFPDKAFVPPE